MPSADLASLEAKLSYTFRNRELLVRALTHRSFASETKTPETQLDNEQLEFFGDSILGFLISEILLSRHPGLPEGQLSRAKSYLVSARWLYRVAEEVGLGDFLHLGRGEERGGGRVKPSLLSNAIEAVIAALYLDGGMEPARDFVRTYIYSDDVISAAREGEHVNYKGELWERTSAEKLPNPEYVVVETNGPAHAPTFLIEARVGSAFSGRGHGMSKKAAEQNAARAVLQAIADATPVYNSDSK